MWVSLSVYRGEGKDPKPSPRRCQPSEVQAHPAFHAANRTSNIRQQYIKALVVPVVPNVDTVTANRGSICYTIKLESEADIDQYVADIKEKLMDMLKGHDVLHII